MSAAFRCMMCGKPPRYRFDRLGDAGVNWSCTEHTVAVIESMQRDWEPTELKIMKVKEPANAVS